MFCSQPRNTSASLNAVTLSSKFFFLLSCSGCRCHSNYIVVIRLLSVTPKHGDSESAISATSETLGALTEQNVHSHLHTSIKDTAKTGPNNLSPSIEFISPPKSGTLTGGRNDDSLESGTNETIDSTGSKRKRVRHRKKKNANDENQMNLPNVGAAAPAAAVSVAAAGSNLKRDMAPAKNPFVKPQSKCNSHVR